MGGDWGFLSRLMDNAQAHITGIGKVWMTVFFLFRILVLCGPAESVWSDESVGFFCDTHRVGCQAFCYNYFFPISPLRFWTLQFIFVATPTLAYLAHVMHVTHKENKLRQQLASPVPPGATRKIKQPKYTDERGHVKIKGSLVWSYLIHLVVKILIEAASVWGQYYLYEFKVKLKYDCNEEHDKTHICVSPMECFMPRPREKSLFVFFMLAVAGFSVFLNVLDVLYVLFKCCKRCNQRVVKRRALKRTALEDPDSLPDSSAPSYDSTMLQITENTLQQNNHVIVELESGLRQRSISESLDGVEGGATAAMIHHHSEDVLSGGLDGEEGGSDSSSP